MALGSGVVLSGIDRVRQVSGVEVDRRAGEAVEIDWAHPELIDCLDVVGSALGSVADLPVAAPLNRYLLDI